MMTFLKSVGNNPTLIFFIGNSFKDFVLIWDKCIIFVYIKNKVMSKTLTKNDLANILRECASYVESEDNYTCNQFYFDEITNTGLFHDAIGKVIERDLKKVVISDY